MRNCFSCEGYEPRCSRHYLEDGKDICMYREIANRDLERSARGDNCLVLAVMLKRHLEDLK